MVASEADRGGADDHPDIPHCIRRATRADLPALLRLYRRAGLDSDAQLGLAEAERIFARIASHPEHALFVATIDDAVVGSLALLVMAKLAHGGAPSAVVEDVAVDPDWQRRGVGRAMMRCAMQWCLRHGCYKLALSSNLGRSGAHAFYEALGFERHGFSFRADPAASVSTGSGCVER